MAAVAPDVGEPRDDAFTARFGPRALALLCCALFLLLGHAFVPLDEFVMRADDVFYYFKVAANYPQLGFWSFEVSTRRTGSSRSGA